MSYSLASQYFDSPQISIPKKNKKKLYKTLYYRSRDKRNFYFLEKGLGIVSPPHFVYEFSTKVFLMLYSIN